MNEHEQAAKLLAQILQAIVETVNEAPNGAPCGPLYAALMHVWPNLTSDQFNRLIAMLVTAGKLKRVGHCLYSTALEQAQHEADTDKLSNYE